MIPLVRSLEILVLIGAVSTLPTIAFAQCPDPGAPVTRIRAKSYYARTDPTRSTIDEERLDDNSELIAPIHKFSRTIDELSDKAVTAPQSDAKRCATALMVKWAAAGALLNAPGKDNQPRFVQQWTLSSLTLAKLKLGAMKPGDEAAVDRWLHAMAEKVEAFHRSRPPAMRNNHYYWAALGVGAAAIESNDDAMWSRALAMYQFALGEIQPDGILTRELKRGQRAAKYHAFAAQPLAMFDLLCRSKGRCRGTDPRLTRLLTLVDAESRGGGVIQARVGIKQLPVGQQGWLEFWYGRPVNPFIQRLGGKLQPLGVALRR